MKRSMLFVLGCGLLVQQNVYAVLDMFSGTINYQAEHWYFKRCDGVQNKYRLQIEDPKVLRQLQETHGKYKRYWLTLSAEAEPIEQPTTADQEGGVDYILKVANIDVTHPNKSCHLLDFFEQDLGPKQ